MLRANNIVLIFLLFFLYKSQATPIDSIQKEKKRKDLSISIAAIEGGASISLGSAKNNSLPQPIAALSHKRDLGSVFNFLKVGVEYKRRFGVELFYNVGLTGAYNMKEIDSYVESHFPNNSKIYFTWCNSSFQGVGFDFYYNFRVKRLLISPKIQYSIVKYQQDNFGYQLKEYGANQFIEYNINSEIQKKYISGYSSSLCISYCMFPHPNKLDLRLGIRAEYFYMNLPIKYTIQEIPTNYPSTISTYSVKQELKALNILLSITAVFLR